MKLVQFAPLSTRFAPLILCSLFAGCGDGALEISSSSEAGVEQLALGEGEVFYVRDGLGDLTLQAQADFEHVDLHFSLADARVRALDADGNVVLGWTDVASVSEDDQPVAHEGLLRLAGPARSLEISMLEPVEFARLAVGSGTDHAHEGDSEPLMVGGNTVRVAHFGRWIPPGHVVERGNQQYLPGATRLSPSE